MLKYRSLAAESYHSRVGRSGETAFAFDLGDDNAYGRVYREHQIVDTEGHDFRQLGRSRKNIGGPFTSRKISIDLDETNSRIQGWSDSDGQYAFYAEGICLPNEVIYYASKARTQEQIIALCPTLVSDSDLDEYGATAISICAPRSPLADAASTIGELRDGLPHIPGTSTGNVGSEYLNIQFGIAPLASEVEAYYKSAQNAEKHLAQLERDAGKWIHRGFAFDDQKTSVVDVMSNGGNPTLLSENGTLIPYAYNVGLARCERRTTTTTKIWFSGCFTYHLPKEGWRRTLDELDYLYGIKPGVDTAWELMPWSWLIDYQTNIGDVLKNINAFSSDGLVMPYGYIMATTETVRQYDGWYDWVEDGVSRRNNYSCGLTTTTKQRRLANPFGFGFTPDLMSPRQWAILAALGISLR